MIPVSGTGAQIAEPCIWSQQQTHQGNSGQLLAPITLPALKPSASTPDISLFKRATTLVASRPVLAPVTAEARAAVARLTGPLLAERHQRIAWCDQRTLAYLYADEPVTAPDLFKHMACRHLDFRHRPDLLKVSNGQLQELLTGATGRLQSLLVRSLPVNRVADLMRLPDMAMVILCHSPGYFSYLPKEMRTAAWLKSLFPSMTSYDRCELIRAVTANNPKLAGELETPEEKIRRRSIAFKDMPDDQVTPELRRLVISINPFWLPCFQEKVDRQEYEQLCDLALQESGEALAHIDIRFRTPERVDRALRHAKPPAIAAIPAHLHSYERLATALFKDSMPYNEAPSCQLLDEWGLWDAFKTQTDWLSGIKTTERTDALYADYIAQHPGRLFEVPLAVAERLDPQWMHRFWRMDLYQSLDEHNSLALPYQQDCMEHLENLAYRHLIKRSPLTGMRAALQNEVEVPAWALMLAPSWEQRRYLSREQMAVILENGGAAGLAEALGVTPFHIDPEALLDPIQEHHCSRRAAWLPAEVCKKLAFCDNFRLPRQQDGMNLRDQMDQHSLSLAWQIVLRTLPTWRADTDGGDWHVKGGRTLVREHQGRHVHMKLQRKGEPLAEFAAEEAVQRFALAHKKTLGLRSEIPEPEGIVFVPLEALPAAARDCTDPLEIRTDQQCPGCLAFCFSTKDHNYDTLAWQADDAQGGGANGRDGLMCAFHDLGVWSSLGAVHTSTIRLYHDFGQDSHSRPQLLLSALFDLTQTYPGTLHLWNSKAIEQSDWGRSGLRDLGDLELYPFIRCYIESGEAIWALPDYAQRASFVNGLAQNLLGGLLHFMRQQREQPGYHYRKQQAVEAMARCVEDACDNLLHGLLRDGTRLKTLFPDEQTYEQWLPLTAREIVYWTAQQNPQQNRDCFACHFEENGRPAADLYPGHPARSCRYGKHFTEEGGENLGGNNGKFPLFYLVRGLYVMAAGVADRLADQQQPQHKSAAS
ncbi:MAG: hypothetical protein OXC07_04040 [Kistimonas sp.]|nr:hypothetical protein [Kistimonas sp.]